MDAESSVRTQKSPVNTVTLWLKMKNKMIIVHFLFTPQNLGNNMVYRTFATTMRLINNSIDRKVQCQWRQSTVPMTRRRHINNTTGMKSLKEKTAKGLFWAAMNNGLMQLLNALIGIFLARLLMPEDYGLVGMLAIFSAIATTIQESGFTSALINMKKVNDKDYNSVFWFSLMMGVVLYSILYLCAPLIARFYNQDRLIDLARVCFLTIPLSAIGIVPTAYLSKNLIIKETTILRAGVLTLSGVTGIAMAVSGHAYWSIAVQQLVYTGLIGVGKYLLMPWHPSMAIDFGPVRRMFGFSSKIMVTNIINQTSNNILSMIFGRLFPVHAVGNFSQAYKWNNMASSLVSGTISQVAQPVLASINDERGRQLAVLRKMIRFTAFLSFPVMLGLAAISNEFIVLLISDKWADSAGILQILCVGGAFLPLYQPLQNLIVSRGRSDVFMWSNIAQVIMQTALILLVSGYGFNIMIVVYSAFNILWLFVLQELTRRIIGLKLAYFAKDTMPFFLAAVFSSAAACLAGGLAGGMMASMATKIAVAATSYYIIMRVSGAKIMKECTGYLLHRRR